MDNAKGDLDGMSRRSPGYSLEAQKRVMPLFSLSSALTANDGVGTKTLAVETGKILAFSQRDHKGNFIFSTVNPSAFEFVNSAGSFQPDRGKVSVNSKLKGAIAVLDDIISGYNNAFRQPLLDARPLGRRDDGYVARSMVAADSPSDYVVGYYQVADKKGRVLSSDGDLLAPNQPEYADIALQADNLATDLNGSMNAALQSGEPVSAALDAGGLYAPFVQVKSDQAGGLETYFAFSAANPERDARIAALGTNAFGFRRSAEQSDYDSLIATNSFALEQQEVSEADAQDGDYEEGQHIEIQNYGFNRGSLVFYRADRSTGAVSGLEPGSEGYLKAALQWGKQHDTIIRYRDLPAMNSSLAYTDLALRPERNYGMLVVTSAGVHRRSEALSSYAAANPGGVQPFAAYAGVDGLHSYGVETRMDSRLQRPDFADLYITSTVDNITIWS